MKNNFTHIIKAAASQKRSFDTSIESVRNILDESIQTYSNIPANIQKVEFSQKEFRTGWLRGSLSYPWVIVCFIIPSVIDSLI